MSAYWLLLLYPFIGVLCPVRFSSDLRLVFWLVWIVVLSIFIGLRVDIGGDWANYADHYLRIAQDGYAAIGVARSFVFGILYLISAQLGIQIFGVNLIVGIIFSISLALFCRSRPFPWVATFVAVPYLVIVVSLGYTRQSLAIACILLAIMAAEHDRLGRAMFWTAMGATIHVSALMFFGVLGLTFFKPVFSRAQKWMSSIGLSTWRRAALLMIGLLVMGGLGLVIWDKVQSLFEYYVHRDQWDSTGAKVRVLMNSVPAAVLLVAALRTRNHEIFGHQIWVWISVVSVAMLVIVGSFSTMTDRLSLYLLPLQLHVWSSIPLLIKSSEVRSTMIFGVCGAYALVQFVWLNFATHAYQWVPYGNLLLQ